MAHLKSLQSIILTSVLLVVLIHTHVLSMPCDGGYNRNRIRSEQNKPEEKFDNTQKSKGTYESPNFPNKYIPNMIARQNVQTKEFRKFTIIISNFSVENSNKCERDKLMIILPNTTKHKKRVEIGPFCGYLGKYKRNQYCFTSGEGYEAVMTCVFVSGGFTLNFVTDVCDESTGFKMEYDSTMATTTDICNNMYATHNATDMYETVTISTSLLYVENLYPSNISCTWFLPENRGDGHFVKDITMNVEYFTTKSSGGNECPDSYYSDKLEIWSANTTNPDKLESLCGCNCKFKKTLNAERIQVRFQSFHSVEAMAKRGGFEIIFTVNYSKHKKKVNMEMSLNLTGAPAQTLSIAARAKAMKCPADSVCNYVIKFVAVPGYQIHLEILQPDNATKISAFDGPGLGYEQITYNKTNFTKELFGWDSDIGYLSGGLYLTIKMGPNAVNSTSKILVSSRYVFMLTSYRLINCPVSGVRMGTLSENTITRVNITRTNTNIQNYICYLVITVPEGNKVLLTVGGQVKPSDDTCNGIVVNENYTDSTQHICGTNITADKPKTVKTKSHRAYIMVYLYAKEGEQINSWIMLDITTFRDDQTTLGQHRPSLIDTCTEKEEIMKSDPQNTVFPGFMDFHRYELSSKRGKAKGIVKDCPVMISKTDSINIQYIELYIHKYYGQKLKITENEYTKTITKNMKRFVMTHVTFKSSSTKKLVIELSNSIAQIEYQIKTYQNIPSKYPLSEQNKLLKEKIDARNSYISYTTTNPSDDPSNSDDEDPKPVKAPTNIFETFYFQNHAYILKSLPSKNVSYAEEFCNATGGKLFSASTVEELDAIKTAFAMNWSNILSSEWLDVLIGLKKTFGGGRSRSEWRWTDGSPLTITDWYYPDMLDHYVPDTINKNRPMVFTTQPVKRDGYNCVTMGIYRLRQSTNWMTIDCDNVPEYVHFFICEVRSDRLKRKTNNIIEILQDELQPATSPYNNVGKHQGNNRFYSRPTYKYKEFDVNYTCPHNWMYIDDKCWLMLHTTSNDSHVHMHSFSDAHDLCHKYHGQIADITNLTLNTVKQYMTYTQYREAYGNILIQSHGEDACIHYRLRRNLDEEEIDRIKIGREQECNSNMVREYEGEIRGAYAYKQLNKNSFRQHCKFKPSRRNNVMVFNTTCFPNHVFCMREVVTIAKTCNTGYTQCDDGSCISPDLICDDFKDCLNGEDESNCELPDYYYNCTINETITISKYCDHVADCSDGSDEKGCQYHTCPPGEFQCQCDCEGIRELCTKGTHCMQGTCMSKITKGGKSDKRYTEEVLSHEREYHIKAFDHTCAAEHGICSLMKQGCFNRGDACILRYEFNGTMIGCGDGKHLSNCSQFRCPGRFKCPKSYCIELHRVCNGIQDCQYGEDEGECNDTRSPGLYQCGGNRTHYNIDSSHICNRDVDCAHYHSDEKYCGLPECPSGCTCRGFYYNCDGNITNPRDISNANFSASARMLNLARNNLTNIILDNFQFSKMLFLAVLRLSHNNLEQIYKDTFMNLSNLLILDLRNNHLTDLGQRAFIDLSSLKTIQLAGNPIQVLAPYTFVGLSMISQLILSGLNISKVETGALFGLTNLRILDLSNNNMTKIETEVFDPHQELEMVILHNNNLTETDRWMFERINSKYIDAGSFKFCCFRNLQLKINCTPDFDIYSSCADLMSNSFLQIMIWVIGCLALVGNISVIIVRPIIGMKSPSEICIFALSWSDLLTGIYLVILATVDTYYRGDYIANDHKWRSSGLCQLCGILSTLSAQLSSFLLLLITLDRFIHLVFPMKGIRYTRKSTAIACVILFVGSLIASIIPTGIPQYFGGAYYSKTALCLAYDFTSRSDGWEYTVAMFISVNLFNCVVTLVCYIAIYGSIRHSSKKSDPTRKSDIQLAKTLFLLVMTDLICWFPLIIASLNVINGGKVPRDIAAMLAVVVLPINAALNPYLYTISSVQNARSRRRTERRGRTPPGQNRAPQGMHPSGPTLHSQSHLGTGKSCLTPVSYVSCTTVAGQDRELAKPIPPSRSICVNDQASHDPNQQTVCSEEIEESAASSVASNNCITVTAVVHESHSPEQEQCGLLVSGEESATDCVYFD